MYDYLQSRTGEKAKGKPIQRQAANRTGIPPEMKSRFESYSGFSFDDVRVHYYSDKPSQVGALAYTQGNQVYVGPGQEGHLSHELGHVIQQKQGRVRPTGTKFGVAMNDDAKLEREATRMGEAALRLK